MAQAAQQAGCHLQAFFLQEQGVYHDVLPAIAVWAQEQGLNLPEMQREYHEFQKEKRVQNGELYGISIIELGPPEGNPFVELRNQLRLSRMGFAKRFCVHPGLLYRVEQGISRSLPIQLREALLQAGCSQSVLDELAFRMEELS